MKRPLLDSLRNDSGYRLKGQFAGKPAIYVDERQRRDARRDKEPDAEREQSEEIHKEDDPEEAEKMPPMTLRDPHALLECLYGPQALIEDEIKREAKSYHEHDAGNDEKDEAADDCKHHQETCPYVSPERRKPYEVPEPYGGDVIMSPQKEAHGSHLDPNVGRQAEYEERDEYQEKDEQPAASIR